MSMKILNVYRFLKKKTYKWTHTPPLPSFHHKPTQPIASNPTLLEAIYFPKPIKPHKKHFSIIATIKSEFSKFYLNQSLVVSPQTKLHYKKNEPFTTFLIKILIKLKWVFYHPFLHCHFISLTTWYNFVFQSMDDGFFYIIHIKTLWGSLITKK